MIAQSFEMIAQSFRSDISLISLALLALLGNHSLNSFSPLEFSFLVLIGTIFAIIVRAIRY